MQFFTPRRRALALALVAAATVAARLPFLLLGERFFDSDQAVEGLMARHVWNGEFPVFLWGQSYKGVPEVYLTALVFRLAGSSVVALKATTLGLFAAYVCVNFVLIERLLSVRIAALTSLFLIVGPPTLVFWTLSGNAEIAWTLLAGAVLLMALQHWQSTGSRAALLAAGAAAGFGFWIHQYILYYIAAIALTALFTTEQAGAKLAAFVCGRVQPAWANALTYVILAVGALYAVLGTIAFLTGGFDVAAGGMSIGVHHAQKLWRVSAALLLVWVAVRWILGQSSRSRRATFGFAAPVAAGLIIGAAPAIGGALAGDGGAPIARMDLTGLAAATPVLLRDVVPMLFGFKAPMTERLPIPGVFSAAIVVALGLAYITLRRQRTTVFFHVFAVVTIVLFVVSGAFVDAQSYRYLMPLYAALPVLYAIGVDTLWRASAIGGVVLAAILVGMFATAQAAWYQRLVPDRDVAFVLRCLEDRGVRFAWADYWTSYKVTFLSGERIIVAPRGGPDRYPPYTASVEASVNAPVVPGNCP